jgi:hypothetical protein
MNQEAVQGLARFMPKEDAVGWAAESARTAGETTALSPEELKAVEAAEAWAANPTETGRIAAAEAAADLPADSPAGWTARGASFSEGVEVPEGEVPFDGGDLTAHCAAGAVLLAAATMSPAGVPGMPEKPLPSADFAGTAAPPVAPLGELVAEVPSAPDASTMTSEQRAAAADLLEPFVEKGVARAQAVPGWV